jgi:hypothetical protein
MDALLIEKDERWVSSQRYMNMDDYRACREK